MPIDFDKHAREGNTFLELLSQELKFPGNTEKASRVLRNVLHALRNILTTEDNMKFLALLPVFLKGVYTEGWTLKKDRQVKYPKNIIFQIKMLDMWRGAFDFSNDEMVEAAIISVFKLMGKYISYRDLLEINQVLPKEINYVLDTVLMGKSKKTNKL